MSIRSLKGLITKINTILNTIYLYEDIHLEKFETISDVYDRKFNEYVS